MSSFTYQVLSGQIGGIHAGSVEGGRGDGRKDKVEIAYGKLYSYLMLKRDYNVEQGYLERTVKKILVTERSGYIKQGKYVRPKTVKKPVYEYALTTKAKTELGDIFLNNKEMADRMINITKKSLEVGRVR